MQLQASRQFKIAVSKSCCPVCWDIVNIFNEQAKTTQEPKPLVCFRARGRHANLYPVDLPDLLDEGIKDELLKKFGIHLLKDLFSLLDKDTLKAAKSKHVASISNPESLALSLNSSLGSSLDNEDHLQVDITSKGLNDKYDQMHRVESWTRSFTCNPNQPEPSK